MNVDVDGILNPVDSKKREIFKDRLQKLAGIGEDGFEWTPATVERNRQSAQTMVEDIENHVSDLHDKVADLEGGPNAQHFVERVKDDIGERQYKRIRKTTFEGDTQMYTADIHEIRNGFQKLTQLKSRIIAWTEFKFVVKDISDRMTERVRREMQEERALEERIREDLENDLAEYKAELEAKQADLERFKDNLEQYVELTMHRELQRLQAGGDTAPVQSPQQTDPDTQVAAVDSGENGAADTGSALEEPYELKPLDDEAFVEAIRELIERHDIEKWEEFNDVSMDYSHGYALANRVRRIEGEDHGLLG